MSNDKNFVCINAKYWIRANEQKLINGYFCFGLQISIFYIFFFDATYILKIKQRNMCIKGTYICAHDNSTRVAKH